MRFWCRSRELGQIELVKLRPARPKEPPETLRIAPVYLFSRLKPSAPLLTFPLPQGESDRQFRVNVLFISKMLHTSYSFALAFEAELVRDLLDRLGVARRSTVLDPFCGTGTTLLECKL